MFKFFLLFLNFRHFEEVFLTTQTIYIVQDMKVKVFKGQKLLHLENLQHKNDKITATFACKHFCHVREIAVRSQLSTS